MAAVASRRWRRPEGCAGPVHWMPRLRGFVKDPSEPGQLDISVPSRAPRSRVGTLVHAPEVHLAGPSSPHVAGCPSPSSRVVALSVESAVTDHRVDEGMAMHKNDARATGTTASRAVRTVLLRKVTRRTRHAGCRGRASGVKGSKAAPATGQTISSGRGVGIWAHGQAFTEAARHLVVANATVITAMRLVACEPPTAPGALIMVMTANVPPTKRGTTRDKNTRGPTRRAP
jgi:hypothetical protein